MKEEPARVIACVARALRPGGRFVAEMGAHRNIRIITDALYQALAEEGVASKSVDFPWYFPRTSHYVGLLEEGGFEVSQLRYFARPTPLDDCPNGLADLDRHVRPELYRRGAAGTRKGRHRAHRRPHPRPALPRRGAG